MTTLLLLTVRLWAFLPLETRTPPPAPPPGDSGFAYATVLGGFFGVGLLVAIWALLHLTPRRQAPYSGPND